MKCPPGEDQDWGELVPETERLDTSAHKAKALLALKARRQRPSRNRLKENLSVKQSASQVSDHSPLLPQPASAATTGSFTGNMQNH